MRTISTIFFNGQFWIALVERYENDGGLWIGKYTFGPEPNNNDLLDFYLNKYDSLKFHKSETNAKIKEKSKFKNALGGVKKSLEIYLSEQTKYLIEKKKIKNQTAKKDQTEKYRLKALKKKEKKRGH